MGRAILSPVLSLLAPWAEQSSACSFLAGLFGRVFTPW